MKTRQDKNTGKQEDKKTGRHEDQEDIKTWRQEDRKTRRQEDRKTCKKAEHCRVGTVYERMSWVARLDSILGHTHDVHVLFRP